MKIGQYCQRQRCKHGELEQFWQAFASRGFVSNSWAFLFCNSAPGIFTSSFKLIGDGDSKLLLTFPLDRFHSTVVHSGHLFPKSSHNTTVLKCCVVTTFSQHNNLKLLCCGNYHNTTILICCVVTTVFSRPY